MITTGQNSNTVAFPKAKNAAALKRDRAGQYSAIQLKVSSTLQTSLDLQSILQLFFNELHTLLKLGSLDYRNEKYQTSIDIGKTGKHSCHYNLLVNSENLGSLVFTRSKRFSETEFEMLEVLTSCLVCPIRNALLYKDALQSALKDPLTGAGNRIALDTTLEREVGLAQRHEQPLSILILDIDLFKNVNDNFGHAAGDCVLKDIVSQLNQCCRDTDATYRYGGEEFIIILNKTEQKGASVMAERIRQRIEETTTTYNDHSISITISIGVAALNEKDSVDSFFNRADKALYKAKKTGRNQVVNSK